MEAVDFKPPFDIKLSPETKADIFHITLERAETMSDLLEPIVEEIANNREQYQVIGTGDHEGQTRIDEAAILGKMLPLAKNINEWAYIIYSCTVICDNLAEYWDKTSLPHMILKKVVQVAAGLENNNKIN